MNLEQIWNSANDLPARFYVFRTPEGQRRLFNEEAYELIEQSTIADYIDRLSPNLEPLCDEAFDVIYTAIGVLQAHYVSLEQFEAACARKLAKNDAKTEANGYALIAGKIRRKETP